MPDRKPQKLRVVLCRGPHCSAHSNAGGAAEPLYARLCDLLGEPRPAFMARGARLHWEVANCLSICGGGPNLALFFDDDTAGVWFHHLTPAALEDVIAQHLRPWLEDPAGSAGARYDY